MLIILGVFIAAVLFYAAVFLLFSKMVHILKGSRKQHTMPAITPSVSHTVSAAPTLHHGGATFAAYRRDPLSSQLNDSIRLTRDYLDPLLVRIERNRRDDQPGLQVVSGKIDLQRMLNYAIYHQWLSLSSDRPVRQGKSTPRVNYRSAAGDTRD